MRSAVAIAVAAFFAIFAFAAALGFQAPMTVAWLVAITIGALTGWLARSSRILAIDASTVSRPLAVLSAIATIVALVQLGRLTVFITDASLPEYSFIPTSDWEVRHNCATSYFVAAESASRSPDIYADSLFTARDDDPVKPRKPLRLGPFNIDVFEYPPPFLLLPQLLRMVAPEFISFRILWYGLTGLFLLGAMLATLRMLTPAVATRALLWMPLTWLAHTTVSTLQKGNVQHLIIAGSMLAMVLFERRRWALGGALLAFATVSKLYPGMLVIYLLARREWRALAWTSAWMLLFVLVIVAQLGPAVYVAFADHMPGLLGGEAFPAFRNPVGTAINLSIPGIVFKLKLLGVPGMGFQTMKVVGWVYTLIAIGATWWLAGRKIGDEGKPMMWLAILFIATLRSPFLPMGYGTFPAVWLLSLAAARLELTMRNLWLTLLVWLALAVVWPHDWPIDARHLALGTGLLQLLMVGLVVWSTRRSLRPVLVGV